jgi:hypothetical protein
MKRKYSAWDGARSTIDNIPNRRCLPPVLVKRTIDFSSTIPFYDEKGFPKQYAPSKQNDVGEWMYCQSPYRNHPKLSGVMLILHLQAVKQLKLQAEEEYA